MTASTIPAAEVLRTFPIGDNCLAFEQIQDGDDDTRLVEFLQMGPIEFLTPENGYPNGLDDLDPIVRDDLMYAFAYLIGLSQAWGATVLEVYTAWLLAEDITAHIKQYPGEKRPHPDDPIRDYPQAIPGTFPRSMAEYLAKHGGAA